MPLKIYKIDASPGVRSVLMTAELLKLNYVTAEVDIMAAEQKTPEYLEKNPAHSVLLLDDGDFYLADSHAIITYLVSKYGAEQRVKLYPDELSLKATIDQRLFFDTSILFPASKKIVRTMISEGLTSATKELRADMIDAYEIMERYLQKTKFVAADHLTVADVSCVASISSAAVLVPLDDTYPKLKAWLNTLMKEEWYKKGNLYGLNKMKEFLEAIGIQTFE